MRNILVVTFFVLLLGIVVYFSKPFDRNLYIETPPVPIHYVGTVKLNSRVSVRLLILKHCRERVAQTESEDLVEVANLASARGLQIKDIGIYDVDKNGRVNTELKWNKIPLEKLKDFVSEQMKVDAVSGDTLVVYTTGHGSGGGSIQILGSRQEVGIALATAAEENNQETIWWQSSCYAAAGLPNISDLNEKQQSLFSMIASSTASRPSYWGDQEEPMRKVFLAIADGSVNIDPDQDGVITAGELSHFMNNHVKSGTGDLLFARSNDEPIFGWLDILNLLPIQDGSSIRNGNEGYIPYPR